MRIHWSRVLVSVCVLAVTAVPRANAQNFPPAKVIEQGTTGYIVVIGRDTLAAIPQFMVDSLLAWQKEIKLLRKENPLLREAIAAHAQAATVLEKARGDAHALIDELRFQREGYKDLAEGYKKLNAPRTFSLEGGFGASGSDTKPALVFGLGFSRLRFWTLLQESNVGGFVGANFPIF